jgi:hypothetical protein
MISSALAQIVNTIAESIKIQAPNGKPSDKTPGLWAGYGCRDGGDNSRHFFCTIVVGPEKRRRIFENAPVAGQLIAKTKDVEASMGRRVMERLLD